MNKRDFVRTLGGASLAMIFGDDLWARHAARPASALAADEAFWATIRAKFNLKPDYINLENGYYCMQPQEVLEAFIGQVREVNTQASYYMRTRQYDDKLARADAARRPRRLLPRGTRSSPATPPSRSTPSSPASTGSRATKR